MCCISRDGRECRLGLDSVDMRALDKDLTNIEHQEMQKTLTKSLFGSFNEKLLRTCTTVTDPDCALKIKHTVIRGARPRLPPPLPPRRHPLCPPLPPPLPCYACVTRQVSL